MEGQATKPDPPDTWRLRQTVYYGALRPPAFSEVVVFIAATSALRQASLPDTH